MVIGKYFIPSETKSGKGEFLVNFPGVIAEFESVMNKFPVKKILYRAFRGKGLEFDAYRNFEQDDDASLLDWKASLRANQFLAKKYIEERDLHVYFLVDVSGSMLFGSKNRLKAEYAAEFVVALSHLIVGSGDRIGLVLFSDEVKKILYPSSSKNQFALFTKFLTDTSLYGGGFDLNKAINYVLGTVKTPYTIFILVSDFIKINKNHERALKLMGSRFETIGVMIRDSFDDEIPKTNYQLAIQDPYSGKQMILDPTIAAEKYRVNSLKHKEMVFNLFKKGRIDFLKLCTDKDFTGYVASFLKRRAVGGGRT